MADDDTPEQPFSSRAALPAPSPNALRPAPIPAMYTREDVVTLVVGDEKKELVAHGHCLASSEFFTSALKKVWKEGQTRLIELPEEDSKIVTQYLDFVYKGLLFSHSIQHGIALKESQPHHTLSRLYVFGERVLDNSLRNAVVKEQLRLMTLQDDEKRTWCPSWNSAKVIYVGTGANSPMRRFIADVLLTRGRSKWLDGTELSNCSDLVIDVIKAYSDKAEHGESPTDFRCKHLKAEDYFV